VDIPNNIGGGGGIPFVSDKDRTLAEFSCYVKTDIIIPEEVVSLTGITKDILNIKGVHFSEALLAWEHWIRSIREVYPEYGVWFVAHNGNRFDIPLLFNQEKNKCDRPVGEFFKQVGATGIVDTVVLSRRLSWEQRSLGERRSHKLKELYKDVFNQPMADQHDALGDVRGLAALMTKDPFLSAWRTSPVAWTYQEYFNYYNEYHTDKPIT